MSGLIITDGVMESMVWFVRVERFIWEMRLYERVLEVGKIKLPVHQTEPKRAFAKLYG